MHEIVYNLTMKNITLAIEESLLIKATNYATDLGLPLNKLVEKLLRQAISQSSKNTNWLDELFERIDKLKIKPVKITWKREDLHRR